MRNATDLAVDVVERSPVWRARVADLDAVCIETARAALVGAAPRLNPSQNDTGPSLLTALKPSVLRQAQDEDHRVGHLPGTTKKGPHPELVEGRRGGFATSSSMARPHGRNGKGGACELSIVLADDAFLRELNAKWRGIDKPTNVLAFPAEGSETPPGAPRLLGDVVIAFETVAREAEAQGKALAHHLRHLIVHGVLHLLGWDHEDTAEAERMEALEVAILQHLDVPDPYRMGETSHG